MVRLGQREQLLDRPLQLVTTGCGRRQQAGGHRAAAVAPLADQRGWHLEQRGNLLCGVEPTSHSPLEVVWRSGTPLVETY